MIRGIVGASLKFPLLVIAIAAAILAVGVSQIRQMPADTLPEFTPPHVEVQTEALGLSAPEVEQLITVPLEADLLHGVAWLQRIESQSVTGLSSIVMTFEPGTDPLRARQMVAERLTQAHALPNVSKPPTMLQPLASSNRVQMIGVTSRTMDGIAMSLRAKWLIRPRLMSVPGVANVSVYGQQDRQLQVQVDPNLLRAHNVTLRQVIVTTANALWVSPLTYVDASTPGTSGWVDTLSQRITITHITPILTASDLASVSIAPPDGETAPVGGTPLTLGDVATVVEGHQPMIGNAILGNGPGLMLVIEKFPGASTTEVTKGVEQVLQELAPALGDMQFDTTLFRPATFLDSAFGNLTLALLAAWLLLAVLFLFALRDWRAAFVGLVTIPMSLIAALLVLQFAGATLNMVVAAGIVLAVGVVAGDAILCMTSVVHRFREAGTAEPRPSRASMILEGVVDGRGPIILGTAIAGIAAIPLFFLGGPSSTFVAPLVLTFAIALVASGLVALTVAPALMLVLPRGSRVGPRSSALGARLTSGYRTVVARVAPRGVAALVAAGLLAAMSTVVVAQGVAPRVEGSLVPAFKDPYVLVQLHGAPGTETGSIIGRVADEIRTIPGVRDVGGNVGRAILSDHVTGTDGGELWVEIDPSADYDRTLAQVGDVAHGYPGLAATVETYASQRTTQVLQGPAADIVVRVYGQEIDQLHTLAEAIRSNMSTIPGVANAATEATVDEPGIQVKVNLAAASAHGIKPGDIRRAATTLLSGIEVGSLFEGQTISSVVVWGIPEVRANLSTIQDLLIETSTGEHVRLADVATVSIGPVPTVIRREGVMRRLDVTASIRDRDANAVMADVQSAIDRVQFPLEYHAEILPGRATESHAAALRLLAIIGGAALAIFVLLQAAFGSWRLALTAVVTLSAAVSGSVLVTAATGGPITLGALVGFLPVLAVASRSLLGLIWRIRDLERDGSGPFGLDLVVRASSERLATTLTSVAAIALSVAPFLFLGDRAGYEIVRPMALVIGGGLCTSTLVTLFLVPAISLRFASIAEPEDTVQPRLVGSTNAGPA